jgi:hypothetical protein
MPTRREKQEALTEFCADALTAVKSGLKYSARFREVPSGRRAQNQAIGDPAYYLETWLPAEGSSETTDVLEGEALEVRHRFVVSLWLEYEDADSYAASSQATYEKLVEAENGLLPTLRGHPEPRLPGRTGPLWPGGASVGQPEGVQEPIVNLDNQGRKAHLLRFAIGIAAPTM